jgi:hypothetical protein
MKPIEFKEANKKLLKPYSMTEDECGPLSVFSDDKQCISCWKMSWKQRIKALIYGRVWLSVYSGNTQPPVWLLCDKTIFNKRK